MPWTILFMVPLCVDPQSHAVSVTAIARFNPTLVLLTYSNVF
jgi:hypothetical protein